MASESVLISGAGIAGPTLAYWLTRYGFEVTLVERAPQLRRGGYVIDFWGLGYDIAERMDLLPALQRVSYQVKELRIVDGDGDRIGGFGVDVFRRLTGGRYLTLPRSDLSKLIYDQIDGGCTTVFGDSICDIQEDGHAVQVKFEHAATRRFNVLIGADGLHSVVRARVWNGDNSHEKYLGYAVAAFEIHGYRPRDEDVYVSYSVPGKQVARFAMRGDRTLILFVFAEEQSRLPSPHNIQDCKTLLHEKFKSAGWECPQILTALERSAELYFDPVSQIRMQSWSRGRVALVGDAAFCPSLLAGQGSALAMMAAFVLAGELAKTRDRPEEAFARYEAVLQDFMRGKQRSAAQFARSFAPMTRFGLFIRNQITKAMRFPFVADIAFGRDLMDRLELPVYSAPRNIN
jgi:2-polyprenyl-6-methoxyphenol hydroxylase-like FAD-dependent oxidoreductase